MKSFDDSAKTTDQKYQLRACVENTSPRTNCSINAFSDCYNVKSIGGVYPHQRHRSEEDTFSTTPHPTVPSRSPVSKVLSPCHYNCLSGRKITPQILSVKSFDANFSSGASSPRPPPPTANERSRGTPTLARCMLVLPRITQDLCASFLPETQVEDVKRLKEARRQKQPLHCSKNELTPKHRDTATAPPAGVAEEMTLPWSRLVLSRRPKAHEAYFVPDTAH